MRRATEEVLEGAEDAADFAIEALQGGGGMRAFAELFERLNVVPPDPSDDKPALPRRHNQRGHIATAALFLERAAAVEVDPSTRNTLRALVGAVWQLVGERPALDFNLLEGFSMTGHDFIDAVFDRLDGKPRRKDALVVLWALVRHIDYSDPEVKFKRQSDLAEYVGMGPTHLSEALKVLEDIGAIVRKRDGARKRIYLNPEGVYRGKLKNHAATVGRYREKAANVVPMQARTV